jgi:hypothetical protein
MNINQIASRISSSDANLPSGNPDQIFNDVKIWLLDDSRTLEIDSEGTKKWFKNNKYHRENGPAIEYINGDKKWFFNGRHHREDGPAVELNDGYRSWWLNGKRHREDGPAIEWADGTVEYYLDNSPIFVESEKIKKKYPRLYDDFIVRKIMGE